MIFFAVFSLADLLLLIPACLLLGLALFIWLRFELRLARLARRSSRREGMVDLTGVRRG